MYNAHSDVRHPATPQRPSLKNHRGVPVAGWRPPAVLVVGATRQMHLNVSRTPQDAVPSPALAMDATSPPPRSPWMDPALAARARHGCSSASLAIDWFQQIELPVVAFFIVGRSKMETQLQQKRNVVVVASCSSPLQVATFAF